MNWLITLLCLILHAFRIPQLISRIGIPMINTPGWALFRDMGDSPSLGLNVNGGTGTVNGTIEGSSDTLFPNNLFASISAEFRHDFAISAADLVGGEEHEIFARVSANGIFKHKVADYASPGLHLGPDPTDAFARAEVFTMIQIREQGNVVPIETDFFNHHLGGAAEQDQDGPVVGGLQLLVPDIEQVNADDTVSMVFTPSGNNNLSVRISIFVRASANGASAESIIAGSTNGTGWNDPVTGNLTTNLSEVQFRQAIAEGSACATVLG